MTTFNPKAELFRKARWNASWKRAGGDKRSYRVIFAEMHRLAWMQAKRVIEAKRSYVLREAMRDEQNIGFPIRSFPGERILFGGSRYVNAIGAYIRRPVLHPNGCSDPRPCHGRQTPVHKNPGRGGWSGMDRSTSAWRTVDTRK